MDFNEKQIEILNVAEKLFAKEGFDGTSVREISKHANINIAMVSYYFGSKEKLLESLVLFRIRDMKLEMQSVLKNLTSPIEKIEKLVELYINRINLNRRVYQILSLEISNDKRDINLGRFTEVKKENLKIIENVILEGQQQGVFRKDVITALIPTTVIGTLLHFHSNKIYYKEILSLTSDEQFENYITTTLTQYLKQTILNSIINTTQK
jgi:AcrR family transcriptional regulator